MIISKFDLEIVILCIAVLVESGRGGWWKERVCTLVKK